ncbi:HlyD family secretion protein [Dinghuibacter silviterrae]|uniref:HlyD family secretion protein n=1 Tax=Dinghuibacter silviterrae TaxID=1539049 RepID=A0A4R8DME2_9BACT|nr:HlyD family efflux transporter periplasmic adaptor subunit [Dinghuibacter silviterrae]TDW99151.1 HlyD family secretion protein [Dinghuibacter silviterrae]
MPSPIRRSEELDEIISSRPGFYERWALWGFFILLAVLAGGVGLIHYPDIVQADATLAATNAPKEVVPHSSGRLVRLLAANDDLVREGSAIGWLESTADHAAVFRLDTLLDSCLHLLNTDRTDKASALFRAPFGNLGELQTTYQQFIQAYQQFNDYLVNGYYIHRKEGLTRDLEYLRQMHGVLEDQQKLTRKDLTLSQEAYDANSSLYQEKVISRQDMRDQESKLVGKQLTLPQISSALLANETSQVDKQRDIDELEHSISQQKVLFQQAVRTLKSGAEDWIRKYVLTAPVGGRVVFIVPLQVDQYIQEGKVLGFVDPLNSRFYAQVNLGQANLGKLEVGQRVQLRFDAYPYQEFGYVEGRLQYISKVPSDSGFLANIELTHGLLTAYGRPIQYKNGLRAQALIVTKDMRLAERFYSSVVKRISR